MPFSVFSVFSVVQTPLMDLRRRDALSPGAPPDSRGRAGVAGADSATVARGVRARGAMPPTRPIFLLSPARCDGERARLLLNAAATFELARRIAQPPGAPLGEVFSFLSGLYFRGKLAYARAFGRRSLVITTDRGLMDPDVAVTRDDLLAFAAVDIAAGDDRYQVPLERDVQRLATERGARSRVLLLGSIASGKYVEILQPVFGERLVFPPAFVGRGDMSRGGLMLRCVTAGVELEYAPISGAVRRGVRPPRLQPLKPARER